MTDSIRIPYKVEAPVVSEAMQLGSSAILGRWRWIIMIAAFAIVILICIGGAGLFFAIAVLGADPPQTAPSYIWVGSLLAGVFFLFVQNLPMRLLARRVAASTYGRGEQVAIFDAKGMTIQNDLSHWQTDWAAIEGLTQGKKAMVMQVAGIAFSIPLTALDDATAVMQQLQQWKRAA